MGTTSISMRKCENGTYEATEEDGTTHSNLTLAAAAEMVQYTEKEFAQEFEDLEGEEDTVEFDDVEVDDESGD